MKLKSLLYKKEQNEIIENIYYNEDKNIIIKIEILKILF